MIDIMEVECPLCKGVAVVFLDEVQIFPVGNHNQVIVWYRCETCQSKTTKTYEAADFIARCEAVNRDLVERTRALHGGEE